MSKTKEIEGTVRFTITVEKDAFDVLERYCSLMDVTKSHVMNSWLVTSTDAMSKLLDLVEGAKEGKVSLVDLQAELDRFTGILESIERERG